MLASPVEPDEIAFTNLEGDVLVAQPNLKFLSAVLVLLWPFGVVFPVDSQYPYA